MKTFANQKMKTLICAIIITIIIAGIFIPYIIIFNKHKNNNKNEPDNIVCEIVGEGFKPEPFTVNRKEMYVANNSFNSLNANGTSAKFVSNSNVNTFVRVKLCFKLASGNNNVVSSELTDINNKFTVNVNNTDWILATNDENGDGSVKEINYAGETNAQYISTYYLYYKGVVPSSIQDFEIQIFDNFKQIDETYNGKFLVAELKCEAVEANNKNAQEWMSVSLLDLTGWEKTWFDTVKNLY